VGQTLPAQRPAGCPVIIAAGKSQMGGFFASGSKVRSLNHAGSGVGSYRIVATVGGRRRRHRHRLGAIVETPDEAPVSDPPVARTAMR
jgi:hypothetical protein